jgi:hypothetical protein
LPAFPFGAPVHGNGLGNCQSGPLHGFHFAWEDLIMERDKLSEKARDANPGMGEQVGEAAGGLGGMLAGAAIGSAAGPVGTLVGVIAGAVGGWWAGEQAGRALEDWNTHEPHYREHFDAVDRRDVEWPDATVGYSVGHMAGHNPDYRDRSFSDIEPHLRDNWRYDRNYEEMRPYVQEGYVRSSGDENDR